TAVPRRRCAGGHDMSDTPLLRVRGLTHLYGRAVACRDVGFDLWPGEVLGIVGESGAGKTTLLKCLSAQLVPTHGTVEYDTRDRGLVDIFAALSEPERRMLLRTDWGIVHQNPRDGLRMAVSAGGNVGERLMAVGARHYGNIRRDVLDWFDR